MPRTSETVTENLFRDFYGPSTFIEKSAIPKKYGFKSKQNNVQGVSTEGYPDFFLATDDSVKEITGEYFYRCKIAKSSKRSKDMKLAGKLYEFSEKLVNKEITV